MHVASQYFTQHPKRGLAGTDAFTQNWQHTRSHMQGGYVHNEKEYEILLPFMYVFVTSYIRIRVRN